MIIGAVVILTSSCRRAETSAATDSPQAGEATRVAQAKLPSMAKNQTSAYCQSCHADVHAAWEGTDHANANQMVGEADLAEAFAEAHQISDGGATFDLEDGSDGPAMVWHPSAEGEKQRFPVQAALGQKPSRQMLVETEPGRIQPTDMAWDPAAKEWFNVFGQQNRRPGEWGHWTGRGMNWNSMCAHCHMTGYEKNYNVATDRYHGTWVEDGISCIQCHGPVPENHGQNGAGAGVDWIHDRHRAMETCAYCHARNEQLTAEFPPGEAYDDHHRLTLPVQAGVFWPDGQQLDEDFNWTSVRLSRMYHAGVTCMDCHDPHTTKTILPVENNALCMQCHTAPGRTMPGTGVQSPVINPLAHSRHAEGSTGNLCVSCHMPTTNYMVRSPRHDHGWLKPDPLMTKELGIPNACNECHGEESIDWAIAHTDDWYGEKMDSRQRARARAVAAAQAGEERAVGMLLELWESEDIPAWRATFLQLLAPHADHHPEIAPVARAAASSDDAMERASAMQVLASIPGSEELLREGMKDPVRLVRFDAAWALPHEVEADAQLAKEFLAYLDLTLDQPAGRVRKGQYLANRGQLVEAEQELALAARWDRYSAGIHQTHAMILQAAGRLGDAANAFFRAARLEPGNGQAMFTAGLAYAEANMWEEARNALELAVRREPSLHRAWYNLGLLHHQGGNGVAALEALENAEQQGPTVPDYPYAAATIYWQQGDREAARAAARRALQIDPGYLPARRLLQ